MADLKPTGRNLILDSLINEQSDKYGFANRTLAVNLIPGQAYTLTINGRRINGKGTLRAFIYRRDWKDSFIVELATSEDVTRSAVIRPKIGGEYVFSAYSFLGQQTAGGDVFLNWAKLELGTEATPWSPAPEDLAGGGKI